MEYRQTLVKTYNNNNNNNNEFQNIDMNKTQTTYKTSCVFLRAVL